MKSLLWLVPVLPLLGALVNGVLLYGRIGKRAVAAIACASVACSALVGVAVVGAYLGSVEREGGLGWEQSLYVWLPGGVLGGGDLGAVVPPALEVGFLLDPLSAVMLFVVTFVGFWIHVYSIGYMAGDAGGQRYFAYLNLFMGAMLLLVLGNNYLVAFVGWEGVGLCSYLLIGFYYREEVPPAAGRKAFVVNRIGDCGFVLAACALATSFGTLRYSEIFPLLTNEPSLATRPLAAGLSLASFVALGLLIGAIGKSAQIPLFVWLPDAMAGPTPVSALIHAATMVTAGVYMVVRSNLLFQLAPTVSAAVALIGAATALLAATIAIAQDDIKKVLAYSTISQLGFMFLAAGVGAYSAAIFHLGTHAFFKALLFLGAGSVIHALSGEQSLARMGGLRTHLPRTYWSFVVGALALAGMPPLAGFFSKEAILTGAFSAHHYGLWAVGLATAGLTACYVFRLVHLAFHGKFRGEPGAAHHPHESPPVMTVPLVVLAIGAIAVGWFGGSLRRFLEPVTTPLSPALPAHPDLALEVALVSLAVTVASLGIWTATRIWGGDRGAGGDAAFALLAPGFRRLLARGYGIDEAYDAMVVTGTRRAAQIAVRFDDVAIDGILVRGLGTSVVRTTATASGFVDKFVVDGAVNGIGWLARLGSAGFRSLQAGSVSRYALMLALGVVALACVYLVGT
jgi:NADH-quinone oxidoreductase subunit L